MVFDSYCSIGHLSLKVLMVDGVTYSLKPVQESEIPQLHHYTNHYENYKLMF
jgi:hypothetical protein